MSLHCSFPKSSKTKYPFFFNCFDSIEDETFFEVLKESIWGMVQVIYPNSLLRVGIINKETYEGKSWELCLPKRTLAPVQAPPQLFNGMPSATSPIPPWNPWKPGSLTHPPLTLGLEITFVPTYTKASIVFIGDSWICW